MGVSSFGAVTSRVRGTYGGTCHSDISEGHGDHVRTCDMNAEIRRRAWGHFPRG